jgi:lysylphosphatidylglycerol synthetase-like protein (DUF2156 family)
MSHPTDDQTDRMIRLERRGIWLALVVIVLLGAVVLLAGETHDPALARVAQWIMSTVIPMTIVLGAVWVNRLQNGSASESKNKREAILDDELRHIAAFKAFRAGFLVMLGTQAIFCLLSSTAMLAWSAGLLAAITITFGIAVFLGCFLFYDRA